MAATGRPDFLYELAGLTRRVGAYRVMRSFYHGKGLEMADLSKMKPLPPLAGVAGLGNIFKDAAKAIEEVKHAGTSLGVEAAALATDIQTVREHVRREHEDFHFKVATLGNGGETESGKEETKSADSSEPFQEQTSTALSPGTT
jgi:hypothetical protein